MFTFSLLRTRHSLVLRPFLCRILHVKVNDPVIASINTLKYAYRRQLFLNRASFNDALWFVPLRSTLFGYKYSYSDIINGRSSTLLCGLCAKHVRGTACLFLRHQIFSLKNTELFVMKLEFDLNCKYHPHSRL